MLLKTNKRILFFKKCLTFDPHIRFSVDQLLNHPYLKGS